MTPSNGGELVNPKGAKLAPRDQILLPMLSVLTVALIVVSSELIARRVFSESKTELSSCLVLNETTTGVRGIPNSVCWEKIRENQLTEYRFDSSGYRSSTVCGPKQLGTYRIVMMGSSVALGERVPVEKTFATLLPKELSKQAGRKVELYNEAMGFGFARNAALRFNDVLAAKPDLVLWIVTPLDVKLAGFVYGESPSKIPDQAPSTRPGLMDSLNTSIQKTINMLGGNPLTGTVFALRHIFYEHESQNQYIQSYLMTPEGDTGFWDTNVGFLRAELSPEWQAHLREFDGYAAEIEGRASAAGVPLVAVLVPNRAQAAMISSGEWHTGFDPYRVDHELRSLITSHGGTYIDILPDFRSVPGPERYYYPLDGHPDARGHAMISDFLAKELGSGVVPGLRAAVQSQLALEQGR